MKRTRHKYQYVVNYTYRDGGDFTWSSSNLKEAKAICIQLMMSENIVWVQGLQGDTQFFPTRPAA